MGKQRTLRALIVIRLSRVTDATTSPERQLEACRELCEQRGYDVVGIAEDLDVSAGATTPFTRPELGPWLRDRHGEFDVLVFYRVDRIARRLFDLSELIQWSQRQDVTLVSATESHFDLSNDFGDIIALLIAKVAEMELAAISSRNASASHHNIRSGKWRGGIAPWGYVPEKVDGTWKLVQDPVQVEVIHEVVERVLTGEPLRPIAADLTSRGVLTPKDRMNEIKGREVKKFAWASGRMRESLLSRTLLGQIVTRDPVLDAKGQPQRDSKGHRILGPEFVVLGDDGTPVVRAEPILTREIFNQVGAALAARSVERTATTQSGLLLRVLFCGECGRPAYRLKGGPGRKPRYRCAYAQDKKGAAGIQGPCDNRSVPLEWADAEVEASILDRLGAMERMTRVWFSGNDSRGELAEVDELLADLVDQLGTGAFKRGTPQRERLDARIAALTARQEALRAKPIEAPEWRYEGTGETVRAWWERSDLATRTAWLRETGVRVTWRSHTAGGRTQLDEFAIDIGAPDLDAAALPGAMIAEAARLRAAGAWTHHDPALAALPDAMARVLWEHGDPHEELAHSDPES
ncbi:recombinase family protein [Gordonia sp. 852002-50395_SCH5434458]|uniref:recombinase family protein n=1 Tax=Gordonia sp. 852002-50395_SCH5434458 TaxID=1834090 RepID=UPI0007E9CF05|nr:recombinase family protein [Gordonia sp. 852002-50395_SCH5434458]OBC01720.1 resolvase [Gordonia sp. 852002-50395_SCH5434458]